MTSVKTVRSAPVYTPPKSKETEPHSLVPRQGAPLHEASAKQPELEQKRGREESSTFDTTLARASVEPARTISKMEPPKNKGEALLRAEDLLNPTSNKERDEGWTVTHNGADGVTDEKAGGLAHDKLERSALNQVKANAALEKQELSKLSARDREKYNEVKAAIGESPNKGLEQLALQKLLFQGKLPGGKDLKGEGTTLDHLARAASGKNLANGVNRGEFTGSLVREMATPSSICQGTENGTCVPTSLMIDLADKNPAEYARISNGLASKEGKVQLADGKTTLVREKETSFKDDGSYRSLNQRIVAPALMEVANGNKDYNDKTNDGSGADGFGLDRLSEAVHGKDMKSQFFCPTSDKDDAKALERIDMELSSGKNVLAGLRFDMPGQSTGGFHEVVVTGTSKENGKEYIHFTNPWGTEEKMLREEFANRLDMLHEGTSPNTSKSATPQLLTLVSGLTEQTPSLGNLF